MLIVIFLPRKTRREVVVCNNEDTAATVLHGVTPEWWCPLLLWLSYRPLLPLLSPAWRLGWLEVGHSRSQSSLQSKVSRRSPEQPRTSQGTPGLWTGTGPGLHEGSGRLGQKEMKEEIKAELQKKMEMRNWYDILWFVTIGLVYFNEI